MGILHAQALVSEQDYVSRATVRLRQLALQTSLLGFLSGGLAHGIRQAARNLLRYYKTHGLARIYYLVLRVAIRLQRRRLQCVTHRRRGQGVERRVREV